MASTAASPPSGTTPQTKKPKTVKNASVAAVLSAGAGKRAAPGTREDAIVIDDGGTDGEVPPAKRARTNEASVSECPVCRAKPSHPADSCPIVMAGPQNIKK
jgi:hypothetical protein